MKFNKWFAFISIIFLISSIQPLPLKGATKREIMIPIEHLNVRKGPGLSYPVLSQLKKGEKYPIIAVHGEWYEIEFDKDKRGWIASWLVDENIDVQIIKKGRVTVDNSHLRRGPDTTYPMKGWLEEDSIVYILDHQEDWYEAHSTLGKGWIHRTFIEFVDDTLETIGTVTADILNVRKEPSLNSAIIGKLRMGEKLTIQKEQNDWLQISLDDKLGWIHKDYVKIEEKKEETIEKVPDEKKENGIVTATSLHIRDEPSLSGGRIGLITKGEILPILEKKNNWYKIEYEPNQYGWVASWFVELVNAVNEKLVLITSIETNIRSQPSQNGEIISISHAGNQFPLVNIYDDWYEIKLADGNRGFVASWDATLVGDNKLDHPLLGKKILIDPGHGGKDNGATGYQGTLEKNLTLRTAQLLFEKLQHLGATVYLTRHSDQSISLYDRVKMGHFQNVDAFISIHYDSVDDETVKGMTTYYFYPWQKPLAAPIHYTTIHQVNLKDRGVRFGNYFVLRENRNLAVLMELGYLSNPTEEQLVLSHEFQEKITTGMARGLVAYFQNQ